MGFRAKLVHALLGMVLALSASRSSGDEPERRAGLTDLGLDPAITTRIGASFAAYQADLALLRDDCMARLGSDWDEWSRLTFAGPEFLSITTNASFNCAGAAGPESVHSALTFDLSTGERVNWHALLAALPPDSPDGRLIGSDVLRAAYLAAAVTMPPKCMAAVSANDLKFGIWLMPDPPAVVLHPELSYPDRFCGHIVRMGPRQLEDLGASPRLLALLGVTPVP